MLGKSLVAGTVLTLLAGGAVYYGTDVDAAASMKSGDKKLEKMVKSEDGNHADSSSEDTSKDTSRDTSKDTGSYIVKTAKDSKTASDIPSLKTANGELINPKAEKTAEAAQNKDASTSQVSASDETPTRKWIDQYLKPDSDSESEAADNEPHAQAAAEDVTAMEIEKTKAQDAEIDAILEQEAAIEQELTDMMAEMADTEMLETLDPEVDEVETKEAEDFEERAKNIKNIWNNEDDAKDASDSAPKTLDDILKAHEGGEDKGDTPDKEMAAVTENEVIDLGNSKITILRTENVEGSYRPENSQKRLRIKVITNENMASENMNTENMSTGNMNTGNMAKESMIDCAKDGLEQNIYEAHNTKGPQDHSHRNEKCDETHHASRKASVSETVKIIMAQAEKIGMSELRDRAYLDLVSYALNAGDTKTANIAMSKIEQVELRDTARNRMAVNYAKNGNAEKAFAILEDIEVGALRDVMRLQVIEALIVPEEPASTNTQ